MQAAAGKRSRQASRQQDRRGRPPNARAASQRWAMPTAGRRPLKPAGVGQASRQHSGAKQTETCQGHPSHERARKTRYMHGWMRAVGGRRRKASPVPGGEPRGHGKTGRPAEHARGRVPKLARVKATPAAASRGSRAKVVSASRYVISREANPQTGGGRAKVVSASRYGIKWGVDHSEAAGRRGAWRRATPGVAP